ncbi:MAG: ATPase [Deltaproteobacteria bacterium]|nr:ATPase [Deltaproteobacteria bacterium]
MIDRADRTINLCELKFVRDEFTITSDYKRALDQKKKLFKKVTKTRFMLLTTLITSFGARESKNYLRTVDNQLTIDIFL